MLWTVEVKGREEAVECSGLWRSRDVKKRLSALDCGGPGT
eukprot:CAMPEP_0204313524 /NCGR_PEP_ID=MMETSP0469-20131031/3649_1 /ASSEMBLY_ACC=CAM_ASM_000384 /TAXON_ID=2969 /ORGANISM="Oxyrrhis marina" /LENGTH=39 /DNA_ID= /DNA_START= /DNA_END= /DNA_ORIENTATION=